ncbi:hypothetical protein F5876DRAFT_6814, partial [Lentinula aff. lateritia]
PSLASGFDMDSWKAETAIDNPEDPNAEYLQAQSCITWLIEPRRPNSVKKWSGSNVHTPQINNKLGGVLTAFAHFVYQMSNQNYVLAD